MNTWRKLMAAARRGLCVLGVVAGAATAGPVPWPEAPYTYFANSVPLVSVLEEFASGFSLSLSVQPGVAGTVNGRFTTRHPTEFISRLGGVYGFTWFTHAGTLHVSRASDVVTRSLSVPSASQGQLRQALADLGVLEPRFGWGELPDQGLVMVSGPPAYVALLEATLRQLPPGASAHQVSVFRLRHASAEDRVIQYRDRQVTQAGLASVLRNLVAGRAGSAPVVTAGVSESAAPAATGLRPAAVAGDAGTGGTTSAPAATPGAAPSRPAPARRTADLASRIAPSIQSDPRLNALVIHDIPERMSMYAQLIAQLDVPTPLIEIEAMIIDINTEKARELGINWMARSGDTATGFGALSSRPSPGTLSIVRAPGAGAFNASTLMLDAGDHLIAQVRLLENHGEARIQSRPSVLTTDNIGALLDLSETFYIRVQGERVATVSPVTAGTTLRVTPRLVDGPQRSIQLTVDIEDGQIQDRQIDSLPTVRRSAVSTQAVVREDEALLIAGYSADQAIDGTQKVPLLGDIPGVGVLFSNKTRLVQRRERLFMIRPKLVAFPVAESPVVTP